MEYVQHTMNEHTLHSCTFCVCLKCSHDDPVDCENVAVSEISGMPLNTAVAFSEKAE